MLALVLTNLHTAESTVSTLTRCVPRSQLRANMKDCKMSKTSFNTHTQRELSYSLSKWEEPKKIHREETYYL